MLKFVLKRVASAIAVMLFLTLVVFVLQRLTPIDPVHAKLGSNASAELIAAEQHRLGYDRPVAVQYINYVGGVLHGNLQDSLRTRRPVTKDLATFFPATIELAAFGLLLAIVFGTLLGVLSAVRWKGAALLRIVMASSASAPVFLVGLLGILLFYRTLGWLPATGRTSLLNTPTGPTHLLVLDGLLAGRFDVAVDALKHLILPGIAIGIGPAVSIARVLRSSIVGTMRSDHVRTARAKGLGEGRILTRHALRNSAGPALSMAGLQVGLMLAGLVVVESIFAWPGVGLYIVQGIPRADFPAIAGVTLVLGAIYVVVNAIVDLLQAAADPRITVN
ncbi:MAG: gsiC 2 [Frankiales bacterium]|nr:gsiC 2 [Frankiales bacterium]